MKLSKSTKPISYLKAHTSELIREISDSHESLIVTQNGEAKVIVQDLETYENTQESLSMLKILAMSLKSKKAGKLKDIDQAFKDLDQKIQKTREI